MKRTILSTTTIIACLLIITPQACCARPDQQQYDQTASASGDMQQKKKKIDRHKDRERLAADKIRTINEQISSATSTSSSDIDFAIQFHQRQIEKQFRLDQLHAQVTETLYAHHSGQRQLSNAELESHTKKLKALERKRTSLREESPERYLERMKRMEKMLVKKLERKERRREERFRKMMRDDAGEEL